MIAATAWVDHGVELILGVAAIEGVIGVLITRRSNRRNRGRQ